LTTQSVNEEDANTAPFPFNRDLPDYASLLYRQLVRFTPPAADVCTRSLCDTQCSITMDICLGRTPIRFGAQRSKPLHGHRVIGKRLGTGQTTGFGGSQIGTLRHTLVNYALPWLTKGSTGGLRVTLASTKRHAQHQKRTHLHVPADASWNGHPCLHHRLVVSQTMGLHHRIGRMELGPDHSVRFQPRTCLGTAKSQPDHTATRPTSTLALP
jgi:hypothetical protein